MKIFLCLVPNILCELGSSAKVKKGIKTLVMRVCGPKKIFFFEKMKKKRKQGVFIQFFIIILASFYLDAFP